MPYGLPHFMHEAMIVGQAGLMVLAAFSNQNETEASPALAEPLP